MLKKESAHSAIVKNEKSEQEVETKLVAAPTSHIVTPDEMYGLEELERGDITLARVKLLQAMSAEASNNNGTAGEWFNTLSGASYGTTFEFVPVTLWKSRTLFSDNIDEKPICRSPDGRKSFDEHLCKTECPYDNAWDWVNGQPPQCSLAYNYLVIPVEDTFPAIVTLMKSSFKTGKALNTLLMAARQPAWFGVYEFYSTKQTNNKGTFYIAGIRKKIVDGKPAITDEEMRRTAEGYYQMAKQGRINFDDEDDSKEAEENGVNEANAELSTTANEAEEKYDDEVPF